MMTMDGLDDHNDLLFFFSGHGWRFWFLHGGGWFLGMLHYGRFFVFPCCSIRHEILSYGSYTVFVIS